MTVRRLRRFAGLAVAVIPFAVIVHLIAEAAATERDGLTAVFVMRHAYFGLLVAASAVWFARTAGLGQAAAERRRRCALLRADFSAMSGPRAVLALLAANIAFFALTQAVEGIPIVTGAVVLGLGVALAGSIVSALAVFVFGSCLAAVPLDAIIGTFPLVRAPAAFARRRRRIAAPRNASAAYSLFIPNRPPPPLSRI